MVTEPDKVLFQNRDYHNQFNQRSYLRITTFVKFLFSNNLSLIRLAFFYQGLR